MHTYENNMNSLQVTYVLGIEPTCARIITILKICSCVYTLETFISQASELPAPYEKVKPARI